MRLSRLPQQTNYVARNIQYTQRLELSKTYTLYDITRSNNSEESNDHSSHVKENQYKAQPTVTNKIPIV